MTPRQTADTFTLSDAERETLACIVGHMIPASAQAGMPGADDPAIFADIIATIHRDAPMLEQALNMVNDIAGGRLSDLASDEQVARLSTFRARHPELAGVIEALTARCYYRDDRVLAAIGMPLRPPFPQGYEVEQGDYALLDPVRARGRIYRQAD
ncbi:hypothetical protein [Oricola sp.]|uniref:hypothetical protein n=1 Tax=Oricola sp. TaxID=1979950 RepID=UPI0025EA0BA4|nr:hypothetical protein [Oricola sp.]MCI5073625.1 hypothetical protein [Oricola sp.]